MLRIIILSALSAGTPTCSASCLIFFQKQVKSRRRRANLQAAGNLTLHLCTVRLWLGTELFGPA
jgi:hypothetical protein